MPSNCPTTDPPAVAGVAQQLSEIGCYQISLGDTIGKATPESIRAMLEAVSKAVAITDLAGHYHDTGGRALDNIAVSLEFGIRVFDASAGGLGGCPYAPGASGNVDTVKVAVLLDSMGYETGLDRTRLDRAAEFARSLRDLPT